MSPLSNAFGATASVTVVQQIKAHSVQYHRQRNHQEQQRQYHRRPGSHLRRDQQRADRQSRQQCYRVQRERRGRDIALGDVTQSANFIQTNTIGSDITIVNSGQSRRRHRHNGPDKQRLHGSLANNATGVSNANGGAAAISVRISRSRSISFRPTRSAAASKSTTTAPRRETTPDLSRRSTTTRSAASPTSARPIERQRHRCGRRFCRSDRKSSTSIRATRSLPTLFLYNYGSIATNCFGIDARNRNASIGSLANIALGTFQRQRSTGAITLADLDQSFKLAPGQHASTTASASTTAPQIDSACGINASIDTKTRWPLQRRTAVNANGRRCVDKRR